MIENKRNNKNHVKKKNNRKDLFGSHAEKKYKKKETSNRSKTIPDSNEIELGKLSYENIIVDQVILGSVVKVKQYELLVCLPHSMIGTVSIQHISQSYNTFLQRMANDEVDDSENIISLEELYPIGHYVIVKVIDLNYLEENGSKTVKISLSMLPKDVNATTSAKYISDGSLLQCAVKEELENGFVMDTGLSNVRSAFLSKKRLPHNLPFVGVGSVMMCMVNSLSSDEEDNDINIKLTAKSKIIFANSFDVTPKTNIMTLLPGTLLECTVEKICPDGLKLTSPHVKGVAHAHNLRTPFQSTSDYTEEEKVLARILYIGTFSHDIYFTLNEAVCSGMYYTDQMKSLKLGDCVSDAKIIKMNKNICKFDLGNDSVGICTLGHLSDSIRDPNVLLDKFDVGSCHPCKIVRFNFIDQLFVVSLKESVLNIKKNSKLDIEVGQILPIKILEYCDSGAQVFMGEDITGFVPQNHLIDTGKNQSMSLPPVGKTIPARLLKLETSKGAILTLRPSLVESKLDILKDFSISNIGITTEGIVVHIMETGLLVSFYEDVCGIISRDDLNIQEGQRISDVYFLNQVIRVKVTKSNPELKKMFLTMKLKNDFKEPERGENESLVGDIVRELVVSSVKNDNIKVHYKDNSKLDGIIPMYHLSDDIIQAKTIFNSISSGDVFKEAVLYQIVKHKYFFSLKPSFHQSALVLNQNGRELSRGDVAASCINEISDKSFNLQLLAGDSGQSKTVFSQNILDTKVTKKNGIVYSGLEAGQSLMIKSMGPNMKRWSAHLEHFKTSFGESSFQYLLNYLQRDAELKSRFVGSPLSKISIGSKYSAKIVSLQGKKFGILLNILDLNVDGILSTPSLEADQLEDLSVGQEILVTALFINYANNCVEVTLHENSKSRNKIDNRLHIGQEATCKFLLCKRNFILGSLTSKAVGQIVYLPSKRHMNDFNGRNFYYEAGKKLKVKIRFIHSSFILADLLAHHCESSAALKLTENIPKVQFVSTRNDFPQSLASNEDKYTEFDFKTRIISKIETVTEAIKTKKNCNVSFSEKLKLLKSDNFPQFNDKYYWNEILKDRDENKAKKRKGIADSKSSESKKRKLEESLDEQNASIITEAEKESEDSESSDNQKMEVEPEESPKPRKKASTKRASNTKAKSSNCLSLSNGFNWTEDYSAVKGDHDSSSSDEEEDGSKRQKNQKKISKEDKRLTLIEKERKIRELELEKRDPNRKPETANDYEELLQKNSSSAAAWLQYIAFHLGNSEIENARLVGRRALMSIPAHKEKDKFAIWSALLRMEVLFGSPESTHKTFKEALLTNDDYKISEVMADIYENNNKFKEANDIYENLVRKYYAEKNIWVKAGLFNFRNKQLIQARKLLEKAYISLPKSDHIDLVLKFAQFEFTYGNAEIGRTIFESAVSNFPKKTNVWFTYADQLIKAKDYEGTRNVYERLLNNKLKLKSMKEVFHRLLDFEEKFGTKRNVELLMTRIQDYVQANMKQ